MITKDNQDIPILQSSKAMEKANDIASKIFKSTPHLFRELPTDSLFKNQGNNTPSNAYTPKPTPPMGRPGSNTIKESKRRTLANLNTTLPTNLYSPSLGLKPDLSTVDWQKKYQDLEAKYKKLEEDIRVIQLDKSEKENRYVKREVGYRKLIDELHDELKRGFSLNGNERRKMDEIAGLHSKVLENINNIQLKTSKVLIDQEKDIIRFFNNKINEIKKQFEEERIKRGKKDQSYEVKERQLIAELEWIKDIAQKIDQENHTLMKKYMDLKALYSTQENDREILLREVILKKKKNAILKSQIEHYEKILEEVGRGKDIENSSLSHDQNNSVNHHQSGFKENDGDVTLSQYNSGKAKSQLGNAGMNERAQTADSRQQKMDYVVNKFRNALQREKRKVQQLKTLYIKELESKSTLEKVLRSCIEDVKDDIFAMQKEKTATLKKLPLQNEILNKKERADLVEKLINDERVLTMIYDKTFYASNKKIEIPQELLQEDDDDEIDRLVA